MPFPRLRLWTLYKDRQVEFVKTENKDADVRPELQVMKGLKQGRPGQACWYWRDRDLHVY